MDQGGLNGIYPRLNKGWIIAGAIPQSNDKAFVNRLESEMKSISEKVQSIYPFW